MWKLGVFILAVASGVIGEGCGYQKEQPSVGVVDGSVFPWVGLLYQENAYREFGSVAMVTLIDKQHVMAPAYLSETSSLPDVKRYVQFGALGIQDVASAVNYTIEKVFVHPNYKKAEARRRSEHDIAIFRLKEPIQLNDNILPVCLPVKDKDYDAEEYYFVTYNSKEGFNGPRRVHLLPRIKKPDCLEAYKSKGTEPIISSDYICAGDKENDSCTGDAGSPLLLKTPGGWTAVAFSHSGLGCKTGVPSVFLTVQPFVDWIKSVIDM